MELSDNDQASLISLKSALFSDVELFIQELKKRHEDDPDSYPIDAGIENIEMFSNHLQLIDW